MGTVFFAGYPKAWAADLLPYSTRTRPYNLWMPTTQGDIRTVGMSGATIGLADGFIAASENPAGLAMTINGVDLNLAADLINDGNIQNFSSPMYAANIGSALSLYPWGLGLGYIRPTGEGQTYSVSTAPNDPAKISVTNQEFYISVAHLFFKNKLSLGASLILGQTTWDFENPTFGHLNTSAFTWGGNFGAQIQLPARFLIGLSYRMPMHYSVNNPPVSPGLPGFVQYAETPTRMGIGAGWIPNRFFKVDFTTFVVSPTSNTALLSDDSQIVGQNWTVEPRVGISYHFIDFPAFKSKLYLGASYEISRIDGLRNRVHGSGGLEINPWIFATGAAIDLSASYRNFIIFIGIDVIKTLETLDFIPPLWHPKPAGFFPSPTFLSDEGVARPLVNHWRPHPDVDPIQASLEMPERIGKKAAEIGEDLSKFRKSVDKFVGAKRKPNRKPDSVRKKRKPARPKVPQTP